MMKVTAISIWVLCLFCSELALTGALLCWECTHIANTNDCHHAKECPDHNSCFTDAIESDDRTVYSLGCRHTDQCGTATPYQDGGIVGRAMVDVTCTQCCSQNTCNRALCSPSTHNGGWSQWTPWTGCDVTCNTRKMTRHRSCTNPVPKNGGMDCVGNSTMFKSCTTSACPVHGGWTGWSPWGSCSVTCGVGLRRRDRTCSNPYTSAGGDYCSGDTRDDKICFERTCADGGWTGWAAWGSCSVSCGGGMMSRSRSCTSPVPSKFGMQCPGDSHEAAICQIEPCNATNGAWGSWSNWNDCSESCGSGVKSRTRTCDSPSPSSNGRPCTGNSRDTTSCNTKQCPTRVSGALLCWECTRIANTSDCHLARECPDHSSCFTDAIGSDDRTVYSLGCRDSDQCGTATQSPVGAIHMGRAIVDVTCSQCCSQNTCNRALCSPSTHTTNGAWGGWSNWNRCSASCGSGVTNRTRSCDLPSPNGRPCIGNSQEAAVCNTKPCTSYVRIVDGHTTVYGGGIECGLYGNVQVYVARQINYLNWGLIGGNSFSKADATVVCRMLGYRGTSTAYAAPPNDGYSTIQLRNIDCQGNETDIMQCTTSTSMVNAYSSYNETIMHVRCHNISSYLCPS